MKIPDSLQKFSGFCFDKCFKLVPDSIDVSDEGSDPMGIMTETDPTTKGIAYLREQMGIEEGAKNGTIIVHDGKDDGGKDDPRFENVTKVIFLQNITQVGKYACYYAINLIVVDIPEGVETIVWNTFLFCFNLNSVHFPSTLKVIGFQRFRELHEPGEG